MKKIWISLVCLVAFCSSVNAQKEDPSGLYKLQRFRFENGQDDMVVQYDQYKYCGDTIALQLDIRNKTEEMLNISTRRNDSKPLKYTGKHSKGEGEHATEVFDSNKKHFTLRWYNTHSTYSIFPDESFINEVYDSEKGVDPRMEHLMEMLMMKGEKLDNKFAGCWRRVGVFDELDGFTYVFQNVAEMHKIYDGEHVVLVIGASDNNPLMETTMIFWPCTYVSDTNIKEFQNDCQITWLTGDSFKLRFDRGDGMMVDELWKRSGLPHGFQRLFGTNEPVFELIDPLSR